MEDTLRVYAKSEKVDTFIVLILVLMEDTLRVQQIKINTTNSGLNPCSNGRYSQSFIL